MQLPFRHAHGHQAHARCIIRAKIARRASRQSPAIHKNRSRPRQHEGCLCVLLQRWVSTHGFHAACSALRHAPVTNSRASGEEAREHCERARKRLFGGEDARAGQIDESEARTRTCDGGGGRPTGRLVMRAGLTLSDERGRRRDSRAAQ
ncbi:hypothetical protein MRX96_043160 [Rhipicephalus microplus]